MEAPEKNLNNRDDHDRREAQARSRPLARGSAGGIPQDVARLLLETRLLEVPAEGIRPYARATTIAEAPEIQQPEGGAISPDNLLRMLLSEGRIKGFNDARRELRYPFLDLSGINLRGADLRRVDLRRVDLPRADLTGADLTGADLRGANLSGAACRLATLAYADLGGATLLWARLEEALNLEIANFYGAALKGTILEGKDFEKTNKQDDPNWTAARRRFLDNM